MRHIGLDENEQIPASIKMIKDLCGRSVRKSRMPFLKNILDQINNN